MCSIPTAEVLRYLGYSGQNISAELIHKIENLISHAKKVCTPKETHMVCDVEQNKNAILLTGTSLKLTGASINEHLKGAKRCITLACTLGVGFESELLRMQKSSMTDAVIFDAIGNAFIESYADHTEEHLLNPYRNQGFFSKYRYSPGYGDLPLTLQSDILSALSAEKKIGLTATDTDILIPRKSITAFIGIFDKPQGNQTSKCVGCSAKEFCKMRKECSCCD